MKFTEKDVHNFSSSLKTVIDMAFEKQLSKCSTIDKIEGWQYKIDKEDIILLLSALRIDTIRIAEHTDILLEDFFFWNN